MEQYNGTSDGNININAVQSMDLDSVFTNKPVQEYVKIIEQPAKNVRFRYKSEERSISIITGVNSTPKNKTFPSIQIVGYNGHAKVVVSCVTKDKPYRPHPNNLVGKKICQQGVCAVEVPAGNMVVTFSNLGILHIKKTDIKEALKKRQELRIDPFRTGFEHKKYPNDIDRKAVRLCFQVFLEGSQKKKFNKPLQPIVSDIIYFKETGSLVISKLSHCSASVAGGLNMILLCEKVAKEDIKVRFFEKRKDGKLVWEGFGDFQSTHVHKQVAIALKTPKYHSQKIIYPVQVYIQLQRPSDNATSEPLPFQMLPLAYSPDRLLPIDSPSTSEGSSFRILENSEIVSLQTLRPQVSPKLTSSFMDWSNFYTLSPIQQQQDQSIIDIPITLQSNIPATTNLQPIEYVSDQPHQLELNSITRVTPENQEPGNIFNSAEISDILDDINMDVNSADLTDVEANLSANLSGLSISVAVQ